MQQLLRTITVTVSLVLAVFRTCSGQAALHFLGQPQLTAYVSRAAPPGSVIYTLVAVNTVDNRTEGISYSLVEGSYDPNLFELNTHTGKLLIVQYLPLESWVLEVQAEFQGLESVRANLSVIVLPEYIISPVFEKNQFFFSLSEYTQVDSLFGVIRAFSLDPESSAHSYSILSGNTGNDLEINTTTGVLRVARELDHETTSEYTLTVEYSESGAQISVGVEVVVLDENDNYPFFSEVIYDITLSESAPMHTLVTNISASDKDSVENGRITYSIMDESVTGFAIDSTTGDVHTTAPLDYERDKVHSFIAVACDNGVPALTSTVIVVVRVANEDDECPVFDSPYQSITLAPESLVPGMELATVHAIDPDNIGNIEYSFESDPSDDINLDSETGSITLLHASFDQYNLRIIASNASCMSESLIDVTINVRSINNSSPHFDSPCETQVPEDASSGVIVATMLASDDDAGVYGELTYAFSDESNPFSLDSLTGAVTLSTELDYEQQSYYLIGVTATDGGGKLAYCLLNITVLDVNDNPPVFLTSDYEVRIPQDHSAGIFIVQPLAENADSGVNRVIEYSLSGPDSSAFIIDSTSGVITTVSQLSDSEQPYSLTVQAMNTNSSPIQASITVYIDSDIQQPALNQSKYTAEICENAQVSTAVLQVIPTINDTFLSLISGSQYYSNGAGVFSIDMNHGYVRVTSQAIADFEQLPDSKFKFSVKCESEGGNTLSISTVEITVLDADDNGPTYYSVSFFASVSENSPVGTLVASVHATDPDSGTNSDVTYSLRTQEEAFTISESGDLTTLVEFDAELIQEILNVRILASNPNSLNDEDMCTVNTMRGTANALVRVNIVNINDNRPTFVDPPNIITLSEDATLGTLITTFQSTDADIDSAELKYSISDGNTQHKFIINDAGQLVLIQSLDHETQSEYTLSVQVSDGIFSSIAMVTIIVNNTDDEPPVFLQSWYNTSIGENVTQGTNVLEVSAIDIDTESVSYWLTGPAEGRFAISATGVITVAGTIDREEFEDGVISFVVVAQGGARATTAVNFTLTDVNDCVPRFQDMGTLIVPENISPGEDGIEVGRVTAHDSDMGRNGEILYGLLSGEEHGFRINPTTGNITAHETYDRESVPQYTLVIEARDMGENVQLSTTESFLVEVGDENDNSPYFQFPMSTNEYLRALLLVRR